VKDLSTELSELLDDLDDLQTHLDDISERLRKRRGEVELLRSLINSNRPTQ